MIRPDYRIYPLADSVADKICAIAERHQERPSTRFRDLVDLVLIARSRTMDAKALHIALGSEQRRRALITHTRFDVPDRTMWEAGYAKIAARVPGLDEHRSLDAALAIVQPLVNPILAGTRTAGRWLPEAATWV